MESTKGMINSKNYPQVTNLAKLSGYDTTELTSGANGYPQDLRLCVIGFGSYDEAKGFAEKNGGKVTSIRRKDGWDLAESLGAIYGPYDIREFLLRDYGGDDIRIIANKRDLQNYLDSVKQMLKESIDDASEFDDLDEVAGLIDVAQDIAFEAEEMHEGQFMFIRDGQTKVYKQYSTQYRHDGWHYIIAVEFEAKDE